MKPTLKKLKIGGTNQWISTLGNPQNEILLILHGGPGLAGMPLYNEFLKSISKSLLLVNWDQRDAGKSYSMMISKNTMNLEQFLFDAKEVVNYLLEKYKKEKLFLLGHSWGSALGIIFCQKYPNCIHKYFGVGQKGDWAKGELLSYKYVHSEATKMGDKKLIAKLNKIGKPPYNFWNLTIQRNTLLNFNGAIYREKNYSKLIRIAFRSKEYNILDAIKYALGLMFYLKSFWKNLHEINLLEQVPELEVKVLFLIGRHDYQVPSECSKEYYEILKAPSKNWYWFEESAHNPMFEEPNKFTAILSEESIL